MLKEPIFLPLSYIERLSIPRVDQAIHVPPEFLGDLGRNGLDHPVSPTTVISFLLISDIFLHLLRHVNDDMRNGCSTMALFL